MPVVHAKDALPLVEVGTSSSPSVAVAAAAGMQLLQPGCSVSILNPRFAE